MTTAAVGVVFDETMSGGFSLGIKDPVTGERAGKAKGIVFTMKNHITVDDVDRFVADPDHGALLEATIDFPPWGSNIPCDKGVFQLFRQSDDPKVKLMIYAIGFEHDGKSYFVDGHKYIHDGSSIHDLFEQTTTLYTQLHEGKDATGPVVGAGVLHIGLLGAIALVASMRALNASSDKEAAKAIFSFGAFFFGELWESYLSHVTSVDVVAYVAARAEALHELPEFLGGPESTPAPPKSRRPRPILSRPAADLADGAAYTVVVIGSGYGGGVAASRLARAGQKVCVLERGKEWIAGDFPRTTLEGLGQMQFDSPLGREGNRTGLYDFRFNPDMDVVIGCGLGGTSLINASVALHPNPDVFKEPRWPAAIQSDADGLLQDGFARATAMLSPTPYPTSFPELPKLTGLQRQADALGLPFYRPPINVAFEDKVNSAGVSQQACVLCGDCVSGCNYSAKTTVDMTFLPDAKAHGADIFTEVTVRWILKDGDKYKVYWRFTEADDDADLRVITADLVIVAAGALGSTELLLRSAEKGLAVSTRVGQQFSSNADFLGFSYNGKNELDGMGWGENPPGRYGPVGPTITGVIGYSAGEPLSGQYIIEEGAVPGPLVDAAPLAFALGAATLGKNTETTIVGRLAQTARAAESLAEGPYHGATEHTQTFLVIGNDDASGVMSLASDRLRISWPGVGDQPIYKAMQASLIGATTAERGIYVKEPTWTKVLRQSLITVHPLGGCSMADSADKGVVNDKGQVFSGSSGTAVHDGLYVTDGSVLPTAAGVNPLLTISALAERAMSILIQERGWTES